MDYQQFLPDPGTLQFNTACLKPRTLWLDIASTLPSALCPQCGHPSTRIHSRYHRVLKDLACFGPRVRLFVETRRFFCPSPTCPQRIFCERLTIAAPWQRMTRRLVWQVALLALDASGECPARCLAAVGQPVSADTLLRTVPQLAASSSRQVFALGINDWAWRKGQRYGTILVDLDRHETIDVLPDREVATVAAWLRAHPELRIITRDRASAYQEAATIGAPQAVQVADRWHLLKNLRETLERVLQRQHRPIQTMFRKTTTTLSSISTEAVVSSTPVLCPPTPRAEQRFQEIHRLKRQGLTLKQISAQTGYSKVTVHKYLDLTASPGQPHRPARARPIDAYRCWLTEQWDAGTQNATHLFTAVQQQGYTGGSTAVREWCRQCRVQADVPHGEGPMARCPSARALSWLLARPTLETHPVIEQFLAACRQELPWFRAVESLVQTGWALLSGRGAVTLRDWARDLSASEVPEFLRFAVGLARDFNAVLAAVTLPWSNGQVEGQVNRLKTLKRSMYGRAGLDLLRARITYRPVA